MAVDGGGLIVLKASIRLRRVRVPIRPNHITHSVRRLAAATQLFNANGVGARRERNPVEEV